MKKNDKLPPVFFFASGFAFFLLLFPYDFKCVAQSKEHTELLRLRLENQKDSARDTLFSKAIGFATMNLYPGQPESMLGNWVTDAVKNSCEQMLRQRVDVVFISRHALKAPLLKGDLRLADFNRAAPFDDTLVLLQLPGKKLLALLHKIAAGGGAPLAGVKMKIRYMKAADIYIEEAPLEEEKLYSLVVIQRISAGNEGFTMLSQEKARVLRLTLTEAMIAYAAEQSRQGKAINSYRQDRISYATE